MAVESRRRILDLYDRHVSRGLARIAEQTGLPVEVRSAGSRVWDADGRDYLDCGGYGVFILGHRHPDVLRAVHEQLDRHPLATRAMLSPELAHASELLARKAPEGLEYVYFALSGSEAIEVAIKLARANGRRRLIAMEGGFHGKTMGALSVTSRPVFQRPFLPLLPDVSTVPFGDVAALGAALEGDPRKACVVVEPVQGEGGVRVPPPGYLRAVADACREAGALLVVDEVQTGLGRLGSWWGCASEGVIPDVLVVGKALGGGCVPVSAVVATEAVFTPLSRSPRLHSSTFSGAPLLMAAVRAALEVMERDDVVGRARSLGEQLRGEIEALAAEVGSGVVREVRGCGLLIGIELAHPAMAGAATAELLRQRVVASGTLSAENVLRLSPPATLTGEEVGWLLTALRAALRAAAARPKVGA